MTRPLTAAQKARNKAGASAARKALAEASEVAFVRQFGAVESILVARDEETARRRADIALGRWDSLGDVVVRFDATTVAAALARWFELHELAVAS